MFEESEPPSCSEDQSSFMWVLLTAKVKRKKIAVRETQMRTVGMAVTSFTFHNSIGLCQHFLRGKSQGSKNKEPQMNKRGHGIRTP